MNIGCIAIVPYKNAFVGIRCSKGRGIILPGGKHEPGETFQETAIRELLEETGLVAQHATYRFGAPDGFGFYVMAFVCPVYNFDNWVDTKEGRRTVATWDLLLESQYKSYYEMLRDVLS